MKSFLTVSVFMLVGLALCVSTPTNSLAQEAAVDKTLEGMPVQEDIATVREATKGVSVGNGPILLDDFNRDDGPIGDSWTNQAASFFVYDNQARGGGLALATYNGGTGTILDADVSTDGSTSLQYTALVPGYADINSSYFIKVQDQNGLLMFSHAACYFGNNGSGGNFGLSFFTLDYPFASGHLTAHYDAGLGMVTVSITEAVDAVGDPVVDQVYECCDAPATGGSGVGIGGFDTKALLDNFSSNEGGCEMAVEAAAKTVTTGGTLGFNISLTHHRDQTVERSFFVRIEDEKRNVLDEQTTKSFTIRYLDELTIQQSVRIPDWISPGEYYLVVGIDGMRQGRALTRTAFNVTASAGNPEPNSLVGLEEYSLDQNYPNPFNPSTTFSFGIPEASFTTLKVYNNLGQEVATVVSETLEPGRYTRQWNASVLPSGVYTYRLASGDFVEIRKLLLLK